MILDSFKGNVLREALFTKFDLPVYVVIAANGKRKQFSGETGYMDAQRYFNDVNLKALYK